MLPPLIAAVAGKRRATAGGDPFLILMEDHRRILSILDEMMAAPARSKVRRSRLFLMLKRKLGKHALAEEDIVYPIVHGQTDSREESKHLYDEHADMKVYLYELEQRLMSGEEWTSIVEPLRELIRRHVEEEEQKVFPELRRRLSDSQLPEISSAISREEAMIV
jgi:hemerythrin-like domain-containing protein